MKFTTLKKMNNLLVKLASLTHPLLLFYSIYLGCTCISCSTFDSYEHTEHLNNSAASKDYVSIAECSSTRSNQNQYGHLQSNNSKVNKLKFDEVDHAYNFVSLHNDKITDEFEMKGKVNAEKGEQIENVRKDQESSSQTNASTTMTQNVLLTGQQSNESECAPPLPKRKNAFAPQKPPRKSLYFTSCEHLNEQKILVDISLEHGDQAGAECMVNNPSKQTAMPLKQSRKPHPLPRVFQNDGSEYEKVRAKSTDDLISTALNRSYDAECYVEAFETTASQCLVPSYPPPLPPRPIYFTPPLQHKVNAIQNKPPAPLPGTIPEFVKPNNPPPPKPPRTFLQLKSVTNDSITSKDTLAFGQISAAQTVSNINQTNPEENAQALHYAILDFPSPNQSTAVFKSEENVPKLTKTKSRWYHIFAFGTFTKKFRALLNSNKQQNKQKASNETNSCNCSKDSESLDLQNAQNKDKIIYATIKPALAISENSEASSNHSNSATVVATADIHNQKAHDGCASGEHLVKGSNENHKQKKRKTSLSKFETDHQHLGGIVKSRSYNTKDQLKNPHSEITGAASLEDLQSQKGNCNDFNRGNSFIKKCRQLKHSLSDVTFRSDNKGYTFPRLLSFRKKKLRDDQIKPEWSKLRTCNK